ncbi:MAG: helix-turn-helix transcriptional regulator [Proteobacteria bacterium]|nr:helix-turn-helix transcriptional regulator [Pseudomonadota bacterium]
MRADDASGSDPAYRRARDAVRHLCDPLPPWEDILEGACHVLDGDSATLIMLDVEGTLLSFQQRHGDPAAGREYVEHYFAQDIVVPVAAHAPAGSWFDTGELFSSAFLSRNAFYVDFMCRHRMRQFVACILADSPQRRGGITVQRSQVRAPSRADRQKTHARLFTDALQHGLAEREQRAQRWIHDAAEALAHFDEALCLVTPAGLVVHLSPLAQARLAGGAGRLQMRAGRLHHTDARVQGRLLAALAQAAHCHRPIALTLPDGTSCELARAHDALSVGREILVLLRLTRRPDATPLPDPATLQQVFALTAAEARVLHALASGRRAHEVAQAHGVSYHTVRSQITALMQKMDCARQVDLVRKALRGA